MLSPLLRCTLLSSRMNTDLKYLCDSHLFMFSVFKWHVLAASSALISQQLTRSQHWTVRPIQWLIWHVAMETNISPLLSMLTSSDESWFVVASLTTSTLCSMIPLTPPPLWCASLSCLTTPLFDANWRWRTCAASNDNVLIMCRLFITLFSNPRNRLTDHGANGFWQRNQLDMIAQHEPQHANAARITVRRRTARRQPSIVTSSHPKHPHRHVLMRNVMSVEWSGGPTSNLSRMEPSSKIFYDNVFEIPWCSLHLTHAFCVPLPVFGQSATCGWKPHLRSDTMNCAILNTIPMTIPQLWCGSNVFLPKIWVGHHHPTRNIVPVRHSNSMHSKNCRSWSYNLVWETIINHTQNDPSIQRDFRASGDRMLGQD